MLRNDRLLTLNEAARLLNCSRTLIWKLRRSGALPYVQLGKSVRIRESDLEELLARNYVREKQHAI